MNTRKTDLDGLSFEDALARLESIVRELEAGQIKLDEAVEAYEQATALKKFCEDKLKSAQLKVEKINVSADGTVTTSALDGTKEEQ